MTHDRGDSAYAAQSRADPDELLRRVAEEERRARRGKHTIFFGAAPGVGKTYSMLEAARGELDKERRDVVVGVIETHGRYDTAALMLGMELLPRRRMHHRGIVIDEFDLDAALERAPALLLVDELAHTNADGSRHAKRFQDVEELLDAGIDVYSSLNVQHLESLNDVIAQITGIIVRETVPDSVIEEAHEVRLVDLPPDELLERLKEGKIYLPDQARRAVDNFFRKGNLIALRELALRRTAERVDVQMQTWKSAHGIDGTWATTERLLVCVGPSPSSARLVRAAKRMASTLRARWLAVHVDTPASLRLSVRDRERIVHNLQLAEQLGAETAILIGENAAEELLRHAKKRHVTKIVVGKPTHPRWRDFVRPSFLDQIVRVRGDVDIYVISGEERMGAPALERAVSKTRGRHFGYIAAGATMAAATYIAFAVFGRDPLANVVMVLLFGIVVVAMRFGYGPSIFATVAGVVSFDFFFIPPYYSFAVSDYRYVVTFAVMFVVAIVISGLTRRIRAQAEGSRERESRIASLYAMSRELAVAASLDTLLTVGSRHLAEVFQSKVAVLTPDAQGRLVTAAVGDGTFAVEAKELGVAEWVWAHAKPAGLCTDTLPFANAFYLLLRAGNTKVGVLGVIPTDAARFTDPTQRQLLETFGGQMASAMVRAKLAAAAHDAQVQIETEQLRNSLLSSVSHDLRTPLTVITGSAMAAAEDGVDPATRKELLETIQDEGQRLNRLVRNLLDMTRLQAGALRVRKEWQPLEEVVGAALTRLEDRLGGRVVTHLPDDLPMVPFDPVLIEQVFINLLENAMRYAPGNSPIDIAACRQVAEVEVEIADRGPGVPPDEAERIFEKFYRAREREGGVGLGLTICRGIVTAHGGRLWVEPRLGGGASFRFTIPFEGRPPSLPPEDVRGEDSQRRS